MSSLQPLPTDTFPYLNHIIRLDLSMVLVVDSKSDSKKNKPWVLKATDRSLIEDAV